MWCLSALRRRHVQERAGASSKEPQAKPKPSTSKRLQTEKARVKKLLNSQAAKLKKEKGLDGHFAGTSTLLPTSFKDHLRHYFFTQSFATVQQQEYENHDWKTFQKDRARSVYYLIQALVATITSLFSVCQQQAQPHIFHTTNVHIVDDTSTKMRPPSKHNEGGASVFTIMNSVQDVHVRLEKSTNCCACLSFRLPTPLIVLEQANANEIHKAFSSLALVTSRGIGDMLHGFGLRRDLIESGSQWKSFIFMGDALRANDASYRREVQLLASSRKERHLALRLKCGIHQIALVRKVAVLMPPRFWSTVVRLAHLFEVFSFRRSYAETLAALPCKSFTHIPVSQMPPEAASWKATARMLDESFTARSVLCKRQATAILEFLNGDLSCENVVHYCVPGCCCSSDEALSKCLKLVVGFMSRGFPVPLLYRFKHYDSAASFITFGVHVHKLLPRVLTNMNMGDSSKQSNQAGEKVGFINELMSGLDLVSAGDDGTEAALIFADEHDDFCESFQIQNAKRKQLVQQEVCRPGFQQNTAVVETIIGPMDHAINRLLKHSEGLTKLTLLGEHNLHWKQTLDHNKAFFCSVMSGDFGRDILGEYSSVMSNGLDKLLGLNLGEAALSSWQPVFVMMIHCVTDTWRRFIHDHKAFQYQMFSLLGSDLSSFVSAWDRFQKAYSVCSRCSDQEFSSVILREYPGALAGQPVEVQESVRHTIQLLLHDIACHSPCSTDIVEIKNGQVQHITSRRGNMAVKTPAASKESALLFGLIRQHQVQKHYVEEKTLPSRRTVSSILKRVGKSANNQHSAAAGKKRQLSRPVPGFLFETFFRGEWQSEASFIYWFGKSILCIDS